MNPENKGQKVIIRDERLGRTNLQGGNKLRESDQEEIQIEEELELLINHDRQEREGIVFLVPHDIRRESTL
jgi:hypothetical protein